MAIRDNLARILERMEAACLRSGRKSSEVRLMGVSKFQSLDAIAEAWDAGLRLFGESRVQEVRDKLAERYRLFPGMELHMIGPLQRNKVRLALGLFDCIQSIDRIELIEEIEKRTIPFQGRDSVVFPNTMEIPPEGGEQRGFSREGRGPLPVLLELHTGEASKTGFPTVDQLCQGVEQILSGKACVIRGLMTMAPYTTERDRIRRSFRALWTAREEILKRFPDLDLSILSMGMSNDFEIAIEEGSTMVRIGTALFGEAPEGGTRSGLSGVSREEVR